MNKTFILIGGGLGDLYRCYFGNGYYGNPIWGCLDQIENIKDFDITVIGATHNINCCRQFLEFHPHITNIHLEPWQHHGYFLIDRFKEMGYRPIEDFIDLTQYEWKKPKVYLSEAESMIKINKPYVVLYPFLGCPSLQPWIIEKYYPLVDKILGSGINIVVLGGNYTREWTDSEKGYISLLIDQKFDHPGTLNYIGAGSRLSAQLVIDADAYIGTFGCYAMVAYAHEKETIILHEKEIKRHFEGVSNDLWAIHKPYSHLIDVNDKSDKEIIDKIMEEVNGIR